MKRQGWAVLGSCLLIAVLSSGCACVDSCCTDSCDFGGCGCSELCGSQSQPVVDSLGQMSMEWQNHGGCGGQCGNTGCSGCGLLSCKNWGRREHFVDGCGQPCYGPIASIAMMFRNSLMSCGCGELYVDEWLSDPPLCNDPCGTGCSACGECGPYVGPGGGCDGCGGLLGGAGCSSGGCSGGGCTATIEPSCGCVSNAVVEPSCGCAMGAAVEPSCGCALAVLEPSCGCVASEPGCGIAGCALEPSCGLEPGCGLPSTCSAKPVCSCGAGGGCGKIGCGRVAKGLLAGTATKVGCKVETFLANRKYKWSQRGRARTCNCRDCDQYTSDIADYRFDTPGQVSQSVEVAAPLCQCQKCRAKARSTSQDAQRVAQLKRVTNKVRQVDYTEAIGSDIR